MRIEELAPQQEITLLVIAKDQQLEFTTTVLDSLPRKHMIIAAPIMRNDKIISFQGSGFLVHLLVTLADQKPQFFQNVSIFTAKNNDESLCYTISSLTESKEFNRRGAFRCYIGMDTHIRVGANQTTVDATIKDVSATGFAFTSTASREFHLGEAVHAVLNDRFEETARSYSLHLYGTIVRSFTLENGIVVYGCKLSNKVVGLEPYIMEKERLRLQRSRGNSKTPVRKE